MGAAVLLTTRGSVATEGYGLVVNLPERVGADGALEVREWRQSDVPALAAAVAASRAHLMPWMEWVADAPVRARGWRERVSGFARSRREGGDGVYGIFWAGAVAGGCGLHGRLAPGGLEIGYWVSVAFLRRGVASTAAALLTSAAFTLDGIDHVEIHHDAANRASQGVPERLGFVLVGESPDAIEAPAEIGLERRWRMTAEAWPAARERWLRARRDAARG